MNSTELAAALKDASDDILQEICREAEERLNAQLTSAIAADQRAMTFLGFVLTLVAFFIGASLAAITASTPAPNISRIAALGAVGLMLSGVLAFLATRPIKFHFVGNDPESWVEDVKSNVTLHDASAEQAAHYNEMLTANRRAMSWSSRFLSAASWVAGLTVLASGGFAAPLVWG